MSDDLLERAVQALREEHAPPRCADGDLGRRRLEAALGRAPRRRGRALLAGLLAASLATSAWAGFGGSLPRLVAQVASLFQSAAREGASSADRPGSPPPRDPVAPPPDAVAPSGLEVPAPLAPPPVIREPFAAEPRAPSSQRALRAVEPTPAEAVGSASDAATREGAAPSVAKTSELNVDVDALYRAAHEAHFVERNPEAALAAWDAYLSAAGPAGTLALEARFNRAIALVRLGRREEARAALAPFARGEHGAYRREAALRLIEALP